MKLILCLILFHVAALSLFGQSSGFSGINIQGKVNLNAMNDLDLEFVIIELDGDTSWVEQHENVLVDADGVFNLVLGHGVFVSGQVSDFALINWINVDHVVINRLFSGSTYAVLSLEFATLPYVFFARSVLVAPKLSQLQDVNTGSVTNDMLLKFDGAGFNATFDLDLDTSFYAVDGYAANLADTAVVCITNQALVDSSVYSVSVNSVISSDTSDWALVADSSAHSVFANQVLFATNNWGIKGNSGTNATVHFLGSNDGSFAFRTNNSIRLKFYGTDSIGGSTPYAGLALNTKKGVLVRPNNTKEVTSIPGTFMYFNGKRSAFAGGEHSGNMDTSMALGSFVWGKNISASRGKYATIFGENIHSDSVLLSGIWYTGESTFAHGKNVTAGITCVAIGENVTANYIRNVAIGKNVYAGISSASIGIGIDIVSTGSTSWAIGRNLTASGHFSTLLGYNVGTSTFKGGFLYGDNSMTPAIHTANHQFMVRAGGGVIFYTSFDLSSGVELLPGAGSWNMLSDRTKKENISLMDYQFMDTLILKMPIYQWTYIGEQIVHLGPMAQDFNQRFGVGELPNYINTLDMDGVTLAGIKALRNRVNKLSEKSDPTTLQNSINVEREALDSLNYRINALYEKLGN